MQFNNKALKISVIFFILLSVISFSFVLYIAEKNVNHDKETAETACNVAVNRVFGSLLSYIDIADTISFLIQNNDGKIQNFATLCAKIMREKPFITDIQLAPNGIVSEVYPPIASGRVDKTIFETGDDYNFYKVRDSSQNVILSGPVKRNDSTEDILVVKKSVYIAGPFGTKELWGFVVVSLKIKDIFKNVFTKEFVHTRYVYRIEKLNYKTGYFSNVYETESDILKDHITTTFPSPLSDWFMSVSPRCSWINYRYLFLCLLIAVLVCYILSQLIYLIVLSKSENKLMENLAYNDSLTRLYNHRKFILDYNKFEQNQMPIGVLYLDLNDFKKINDTYGHKTGDELLKIVARKLDNNIRDKDLAYRVGGDEFIIIVHDKHDADFYQGLKRRLEESIACDTVIGDVFLNVGISVGFSLIPYDTMSYCEALTKAEKEMYADKAYKKLSREKNTSGKSGGSEKNIYKFGINN